MRPFHHRCSYKRNARTWVVGDVGNHSCQVGGRRAGRGNDDEVTGHAAGPQILQFYSAQVNVAAGVGDIYLAACLRAWQALGCFG